MYVEGYTIQFVCVWFYKVLELLLLRVRKRQFVLFIYNSKD